MHQAGLEREPRPEMYFPFAQQANLGYDPQYIIVKTSSDQNSNSRNLFANKFGRSIASNPSARDLRYQI